MIGQTFGHYRIEAQLGAGGMGVVYRAYDTMLHRTVAIKVLAGDPAAASRDRLLREARAASALNHPHICTVHEVGDANGQIFLVMEHIDGRVLRDLIPAEGLPTTTVVRYGAQIADALGHAHDHGITHRDLKTANVIVTPDGRAKVLDFGLARRAETGAPEIATQTSTGDLGAPTGTLAYMAPEVLRGEASDTRSDIWALGVVLFEMASGRLPYTARSSMELVSAILRDPLPALPVTVPVGLAGIIQRCLAREPGLRYQRAGEVRAALDAVGAGAAVSAAALPRARPGSRGFRWGALIGAAILLVAAVVFFTSRAGVRDRLLGTRLTMPRVESIAVLPLRNLSGNANDDYFAEGMTETLISNLAQIRALKVISRTSAMRYKGSSKSLPEIARELGVDAVIEGSVQRGGGRVRVTAQLIHAATDTHLWARDFDRDAADVLQLESDVARAIAEEIRVQVTPQERARLSGARSTDPAAYEAYLLGRHHLSKRNEEDLRQAIERFDRATQLDPRFAAAYAGLANAWSERGIWGAVSFQQAQESSRAAALEALSLDAGLAEAHVALAQVKQLAEWDWAGAEREYRQAIALDAGSLSARHYYANFLMVMGRFPEAIAEIQRAAEIDPLSSLIQSTYGRILYRARRYGDAVPRLQRAIELDPGEFGAYGRLADVYEQTGRLQEAIDLNLRADSMRGLSMGARYSPALARLYALTGKRREARDMLERAKKEERGAGGWFNIAQAYAALGDNDEAFAALDRTIAERNLIVYVKTEPKLDSLHADPRWAALLRRLNLPE